MTSDAVHCTHSTNVHESTTHKEVWSGTGKAEGPLGRIHYFESPHGVRSRLASGGLWDAFIHHPSATPKSLRLVVRAIRHRGIESQRVLLVPKLTPGEWRFTLDKVRQHYATGGFRAGPFRTQISCQVMSRKELTYLQPNHINDREFSEWHEDYDTHS